MAATGESLARAAAGVDRTGELETSQRYPITSISPAWNWPCFFTGYAHKRSSIGIKRFPRYRKGFIFIDQISVIG